LSFICFWHYELYLPALAASFCLLRWRLRRGRLEEKANKRLLFAVFAELPQKALLF